VILLDSDIVSLLPHGHALATQRIREIGAAETVATTIITYAEIMRARFEFLLKAADAKQLLRAQTMLEESHALLNDLQTVYVDEAAASEFERLRPNTKLRKIGRVDLLIAAIALANQATLVTRNLRHFRQVPGLKIANWAD